MGGWAPSIRRILGRSGGACDPLEHVSAKTEPRPALKKAETKNRRGSPEAVEKRRAARLFNKALLGDPAPGTPDGRTERRRKRLLEELANGAARGSKRGLKPVDVLARVQELLALGEPLASIRRACPAPRAIETTPEVVEGIRRLHEAYAFPAEAYAFVGLDGAALRSAGVVQATHRPPGPGLRGGSARGTRAARRVSRTGAA
jgi:hypothetical protein